MGSAALYHAAASGLEVLGIDRYDPPHELGSSHAETRVTRLAVAEGAQYVPLVARSHEIWKDLETKTGIRLLYQPGACIINSAGKSKDARWGDFVSQTQAIAAASGIDYSVLSAADFGAMFPNVVLDPGERIGFEPTGGIVMAEAAVSAQLDLARGLGAQVLTNRQVTEVKPQDHGVSVRVGSNSYSADNAIVATGPWFAELAPPADGQAVAVTRQVAFWFEPEDPDAFSAERFPAILWAGEDISEYMAIFPMPPNGVPGLKMLGEQFSVTTSGAKANRVVSQTEVNDFYEKFISVRLRGVTPKCVKSSACLYTSTVDDHFLIDFHPTSERILFASPCSGHGFKHSSALGEAMVQLVTTGVSRLDLSSFGRTRTH